MKRDTPRSRSASATVGFRQRRGDVGEAQDRTGDQMGEERKIERDVNGIAIGGCVPSINVDHVGERLEGDERNADRQMDRDMRESESRPACSSRMLTFKRRKFVYLK